MINSFEQFLLLEAEEDKVKLNNLRSQISKSFSDIEKAKKAKKPNDLNSEIASINNQANAYIKIANLMKALANELRKSATGPKKAEAPLY